MTHNSIRVETSGAVLTITLNRPEKLNAFNDEMSARLQTALQTATAPEIRAVLLTGAGRGFCTGQDLADRLVVAHGGSIDLGLTVARNWNPVVTAIRSLQKPVVCAVNGVAAGAGANLALSCDIVLAARSARFIQPFCRLGLVPDCGGTYHLPRLVGEARAKAITLLGEPVTAEQAETWGMIWKAVDDDALADAARSLAAHLATQPTHGLGLIKQALHRSAGNTLDDQLALESTLQREAGATPDYAEGLRAFMEKRPARFTGRP